VQRFTPNNLQNNKRVRRQLALEPPRTRNRTVDRLDRNEVERLIQSDLPYPEQIRTDDQEHKRHVVAA
jgi:hypothetical protein